jgi:hypothetical protein
VCNRRTDDHRSELKNTGMLYVSTKRCDSKSDSPSLFERQERTNRKQPGRTVNYTFVQLEEPLGVRL